MQSLSQLTQLTWLCPKVSQGVTTQSVFALAALRELRFLYIRYEAVGVPEELEEFANLYSDTSSSQVSSLHHRVAQYSTLSTPSFDSPNIEGAVFLSQSKSALGPWPAVGQGSIL